MLVESELQDPRCCSLHHSSLRYRCRAAPCNAAASRQPAVRHAVRRNCPVKGPLSSCKRVDKK